MAIVIASMNSRLSVGVPLYHAIVVRSSMPVAMMIVRYVVVVIFWSSIVCGVV